MFRIPSITVGTMLGIVAACCCLTVFNPSSSIHHVGVVVGHPIVEGDVVVDGVVVEAGVDNTPATTKQPELSLMEEIYGPAKHAMHVAFDPPVEINLAIADKYSKLIPHGTTTTAIDGDRRHRRHLGRSTESDSGSSDSGSDSSDDDDNDDDDDDDDDLLDGGAKCNNDIGLAAGEFACKNMDILAFLTGPELGSPYASPTNPDPIYTPTFVGEVWGWTDYEDEAREYALVHLWDGTSIVDISDPYNPQTVVFIETTGGVVDGLETVFGFNAFRDIKVANDVMYVGSEVRWHGVQSFDLAQLKDLPRGFESPEQIPIVAPDDVILMNQTHNLAVSDEANILLAMGLGGKDFLCPRDSTTGLRGSLALFDLSDPSTRLQPPLLACVRLPYGRGYVHDATCVKYAGPDANWQGVNICVLFMESTIVLFNLDILEPIRDFVYPTWRFVHQGWFSEDHSFLYVTDEWDEQENSTGTQYATNYIFNLTDLNATDVPMTTFVTPSDDSHVHVDHNLYVHEGYVYQAAYTAGARIRRIMPDYSLQEVAYIDLENLCECVDGPADPGCACNAYFGTWTFYPYFDSGVALAGSIADGLFLLKPNFKRIEKELRKTAKQEANEARKKAKEDANEARKQAKEDAKNDRIEAKEAHKNKKEATKNGGGIEA